MSEKDIFELRVLKDGVPLSIQITGREIIFSVLVEEGEEPNPESLKIIKELDSFAHERHVHTCPEELDQPEKIVFFIRWSPK